MKADIITKGEGIDELANKCIQLDLKWFWGWCGHKEKEPSQVCAAYLDNFEFRVIHFVSGYEAELAYFKDKIMPLPFKDQIYKTRKEAQEASEMLIFDFMKIIIKTTMKLKSIKKL